MIRKAIFLCLVLTVSIWSISQTAIAQDATENQLYLSQEYLSPFTVELKNRAVGSNAAFFTLSVRANETLYFFDFNLNCPKGIIIQRIFPLEEKTIENLITKGAITIAGSLVGPMGLAMSVLDLFDEYFEQKRTTRVTTFGIKNPLPGETAEFLFWLSPVEDWQEWKVELTTKWQKNPNETISSDVKVIAISQPYKEAAIPEGFTTPGLEYLGRNPQGYEEYRNLKDNSILVKIPAGEFLMGSTEEEIEWVFENLGGDIDWYQDELPQHAVYLDAYYVDKYEVTNLQFSKFLNEEGNQEETGDPWLNLDDEDCLIEYRNGRYQPRSGYENHPVIDVTWFGARAYAKWAGKRLPTEAEWEKAARGGLVAKRYPWGDEGPQGKCNYYYYEGNLTTQMSDLIEGRGTLPVGSFPPNGYGLFDMAGNVWEWVSDWYDEDYYLRSPYQGPLGANKTLCRVPRGGSWFPFTWDLRCARRYFVPPNSGLIYLGFRCVKSL